MSVIQENTCLLHPAASYLLCIFYIFNGAFFPPSDKTRLWYRDEQHQNKLWFEVGTQVLGLKAFSKSSQAGM